jgi:hypothetical protein
MPSVTYSSPYPIIFICDSSNQYEEIPEYDPSTVVSVTDTCISIRANSEIDSEVTVVLERNLTLGFRGIEVYCGSIHTPSGRVSVIDSENNRLLESGETGAKTFIRIWVDNEEHPENIWIEAK